MSLVDVLDELRSDAERDALLEEKINGGMDHTEALVEILHEDITQGIELLAKKGNINLEDEELTDFIHNVMDLLVHSNNELVIAMKTSPFAKLYLADNDVFSTIILSTAIVGAVHDRFCPDDHGAERIKV